MRNIYKKLSFFPTINYKEHELYRDFLSNTRALDRIDRLKQYWPYFWNGLYEYKENVKRLFKNRKLYKDEKPSKDYMDFVEQGLLLKQVDTQFVNELKRYLNAHIGYNMDTVEFEGQEERHYITFNKADENIKRLHDELLEKYNVIDIIKRYTKAKHTNVEGWKLRIQQHDKNFKQGLFEDKPNYTPPTNYIHVDSSMPKSQVRMGFYLGDVKKCNGPFCYIPGSHKLKEPFWRIISRRVNHKTGLQKWGVEQRRSFMKLPGFFRHKAEFGNDLKEGHELTSNLIDYELPVTSAEGNFIVFDNSGFHRGGLVEQGKRISLQWSVAAVD